MFIFWRNIYKKILSKFYLYTYISFLVLFFLYYIFIFNNAKLEYIPKENFQVINHDKEFHNEDNAFNLVNNFNPQLIYDIQDINYYCLWNNECSEEDITEAKKIGNIYIKNNFLTYINYIEELNKISDKKYIKIDNENDKFLQVNWLSTLIKFQKIVDVIHLENNDFDQIIKYYENNYKLSDMLLSSDTGLVPFIVWSSLRVNILDNFDYLLENNVLNNKQKLKIFNLISEYEIKNTDEIFENVIKSEYHSSKIYIYEIKNSLIFNHEEFLNYKRFILQKKYINSEAFHFSFDRNFFTKMWIYNFLYSDISFISYRSDLEKIKNLEEKFVRKGKLGIIN